MAKIDLAKRQQSKDQIPKFNVGDTIRVYMKIIEEDRTRIQAFEGICIRKKGSGIQQTFTVRRISYGEGVERVFPLHSPVIEKIVVVKEGRVRRARLYYLRSRIGKKSKVEEKRESASPGDASL